MNRYLALLMCLFSLSFLSFEPVAQLDKPEQNLEQAGIFDTASGTFPTWGEIITPEIKPAIHQINGNDPSNKEAVRVLTIGNSFSEDAVENYLYEIAEAEGISMIIGNLVIGGASLQLHWDNADKNAAVYSYRKIDANGDKIIKSDVTIQNAIVDEEWDYISFQQVSNNSGQYETFVVPLPLLVDYSQKWAINPDVKYLLHQTWAYPQNSNHPPFANYDHDQEVMYKAIVSAVRSAQELTDIDKVVPSGTAIQNARTSLIGDNLNRDGFHLDLNIGRYIAACTWFEALTGKLIIKNTFKPATISNYELEIAKYAAHYANLKPDEITEMVDFKIRDNAQGLEDIYLADPTIFYHNATYYLYGTTSGEAYGQDNGFVVFTSNDFENWEGPSGNRDGFALKEGEAFGSNGFWAPQVFEHNEKFYMAYTANENIAIAISDSPLGPFTNTLGQALEAPVKQIDPFIFIDDNGKKYLYHVRLEDGNRIFVAELNDDLMSIKPETLKECISAEEQWENTEDVPWSVVEGPTVIKKEDVYYLIYSANDFRNPDYAVGYASSTSPFGPWKKSDKNPIIFKGLTGENGSGHGDIVVDDNDEMQYVLHTHFSEENVHPRKTAIIRLNFRKDKKSLYYIDVDDDTFQFLENYNNTKDSYIIEK